MELDQLKRIIEAALLASAQPLSVPQISGLFDEFDMPTHDDVARAVARLQDDCAGRGVELVEVASGFRYQVCQDVHVFVGRLWTERQTRYSRALLETLSLIAYRQPITRGEIEQIRGVAVSTHMVRTLEERDWVRVVGYRDLPGKPALFGTTKQFLDYFNLKSLDELPPLSEIRDLEEMDPQLVLGTGIDTIVATVPAEFASGEAEYDVDESDAATVEPSAPAESAAAGDARIAPSPETLSPSGDDAEETPESVA
jgi:segregation and condensation protein B